MNNDLISRKAAIEAIYALHADGENGVKEYQAIDGIPSPRNDYTEGLIDCIFEIEDLSSAQQWIPCSERLPEEHGEYLVCYRIGKYDYIKVMKYGNGEDFKNCWYQPSDDFYDYVYTNIIAWQPLPEPYVEVENNVY